MMTDTRVSIARGLSVMGTVAFLGVLGYYLGQPGFTWTRLALFVVLGGLAVVGTAGVFYQRELIAVGGACALLLMGFWQAALWMYIFPVVAIFVISALLIATDEQRKTPVTG
ncbi:MULTISPECIES: hypothetical protein [Halobacterium]|uniref:hypothetical protein n=1 Tax=Halobacterium TaxID=2239 RepID=UPI0012FA7308|nr:MULTISPECIES: hypothetical protein [Halobacterium]MCG1004902.1 hypothetical protein [Halobacterium noricense]